MACFAWPGFVSAEEVNAPKREVERFLPGTAALTLDRPLDVVMVEGIERHCLQGLKTSRALREGRWKRDFSSVDAYGASVTENRERFRVLIGAVDARVTADPAGQHRFELITKLGRSSVLATTQRVTAHAVRWPVLAGVTAEGVLLVPRTVRAGVVAVPDADWTPEMFCGLDGDLPKSVQFAQRLAEAGCLVAIPMLLSRSDVFSGNPHLGQTNQPHREFLYRQAFEVGRHVIGYEVQKVLAAVDLIEQHGKRDHTLAKKLPIGVAGVGEGALLAMYAAALDSRIRSSLVCGYFQEREGVWKEPIYRNVWRLLTEFGDAELAGLIAPRRLVIQPSGATEVSGPPDARKGRRASAAPGRIVHPPLTSVHAEVERARAIYRNLGKAHELSLVVKDGSGVTMFASGLGIEDIGSDPMPPWKVEAVTDAAAREQRQLDEAQAHVQGLLRHSAKVREARWQPTPASVQEWEKKRIALRDRVHIELIGRLPRDRRAPKVRSRLLYENKDYTGYTVMLEGADGLISAGILLLPANLQPGERRPLVVCQHGLEGTPADTISREEKSFAYYKAFSEELVKRGFIVFAPQNPYRGGDRFRMLQRMANPLGRSIFSYIIAQHEQILDWLASLPFVDPTRIAFYGLSYGGKTAMRIPPLVNRYCLSICSGDFTDWPRTVASNEDRFSYLFTIEYEIPEWNLAHEAGYAELAMLMAPRPFMVEAGHRDGGQPTELVAAEFGKVRRFYDQLKIGPRAEIEFFDGPHTIHGQGTFRFLHRQLDWPSPR